MPYSDNCMTASMPQARMWTLSRPDTMEAIRLIKKELPEERWPEQIKGDFEIEWRF